jgi:hypothetical protein
MEYNNNQDGLINDSLMIDSVQGEGQAPRKRLDPAQLKTVSKSTVAGFSSGRNELAKELAASQPLFRESSFKSNKRQAPHSKKPLGHFAERALEKQQKMLGEYHQRQMEYFTIQ